MLSMHSCIQEGQPTNKIGSGRFLSEKREQIRGGGREEFGSIPVSKCVAVCCRFRSVLQCVAVCSHKRSYNLNPKS